MIIETRCGGETLEEAAGFLVTTGGRHIEAKRAGELGAILIPVRWLATSSSMAEKVEQGAANLGFYRD